MHSQARRGAVGCPMVSGDLPRGRSVGHTHTLEEEGEGPPSLSGINRQRQPGGAPAQAGAQDGSPAEHGQARGGGVTTPQKAGLAPKEEGGISRSPTSSQQQPPPLKPTESRTPRSSSSRPRRGGRGRARKGGGARRTCGGGGSFRRFRYCLRRRG